MAYLPEEYSLIMIGGDDRGLYENLAKELNVISRCFWLHFVPNKELPLWHSWADCFCVPSRWEGFGFVFIEAAACGNAVITSNIAPMNEYLTHDISACLVDNYETPDAVATAIRKVCEDTTYRTQIINGGIAVGEKFGRTRVDELEITYYSEVLSFSKKSNRWNFLSKITTLLRKWFVL
jgi:glycosyltransferase involved in cell wall biosynthesis